MSDAGDDDGIDRLDGAAPRRRWHTRYDPFIDVMTWGLPLSVDVMNWKHDDGFAVYWERRIHLSFLCFHLYVFRLNDFAASVK